MTTPRCDGPRELTQSLSAFARMSAADAKWNREGLRADSEYRDLGLAAATQGRLGVKHIRAIRPMASPTGWHWHDMTAHFACVLRGWLTFRFAGVEGDVTLRAGDGLSQPAGLHRELREYAAHIDSLKVRGPRDNAVAQPSTTSPTPARRCPRGALKDLLPARVGRPAASPRYARFMSTPCRRAIRVLALAFAVLYWGRVLAGPGSLDPTFETFGIAAVPSAAALAVQPDGKILAGGAAADRAVVTRIDADGRADPAFGIAGTATVPTGTPYAETTAIAPLPDGGIVAAGIAYTEFRDHAMVFVARLGPDGRVDTSFAGSGFVVVSIVPSTPVVDGVHRPDSIGSVGLAVQPDGKPIVGGLAHSPLASAGVPFLLRFNAAGSADDTYGDASTTLATFAKGVVLSMFACGPMLQPDGSVLMCGRYYLPSGATGIGFDFVMKLGPDGLLDRSFGYGGVAPLPFPAAQTIVQPDGGILVAAQQSGPPMLRTARLDAHGKVDAAFGDKGVAKIALGTCRTPMPANNDPCPLHVATIALQPDGRIVQTGVVFDGLEDVGALGRFNPDGSPDAGFGIAIVKGLLLGREASSIDASGTRLYVSNGVSSTARFLLVVTPTAVAIGSGANPAPEGATVELTATISGSWPEGAVAFGDGVSAIPGCTSAPAMAQGPVSATAKCAATLSPGAHVITAAYLGSTVNSPAMSPMLVQVVGEIPGTRVAEFHNTFTGDYFLTSDASEAGKLTTPWQATGREFHALPDGTPHTRKACRYFSGSAFAPMSSHFFGLTVDECLLSAPWRLEGYTFAVMLPDFAAACAQGTLPLYRVYNNGQGGVPHHRNVTDVATRDAMLAQGWIAEGAGTGVVACVTP